MKKVLIVAAAAGLITLAACTPSANNAAEATNDVANAGVYEDLANTTVDANASNVAVEGNEAAPAADANGAMSNM